jgi:transposase
MSRQRAGSLPASVTPAGCEVGDWRRFPRASTFMGFCGLVPSEYSSGRRTWRGQLTKAGNAHLRAQLVESAWSYQYRPAVGAQIARRQQGLDPQVVARAWAAQLRLCGRFRRLAARKTSKNLVVAAIARELAGFLWAEMTPVRSPTVHPPCSRSAEEVS